MGLDEKGRQELRPRGPSSMLPLNSIIKGTFHKFDHDFQAANLPEGKYIRANPSTAKWYKVGQPCYEDKIQELNTDFAEICITPKPSGAPMGKVPLPILKELEHQARQNISTLNFATTFAKTSSCNGGPRWQSGNTLASHLCGRGSIPIMAVSGKAGSCLPLVGSLQYRTLANYMYWFPLPF